MKTDASKKIELKSLDRTELGPQMAENLLRKPTLVRKEYTETTAKTTPSKKKEDPMHPENSKFKFKCKLKTPLPRAKVSRMISKLENPKCSPLPSTNNSKNNLISKLLLIVAEQ